MKKCLIKATGWIGDTFFALSLPQKLKEELGFEVVDFLTYRPQPIRIINANKFVDNIFFNKVEDESQYDEIFEMPIIEDKNVAPTIQFQKSCGLKNLSTEFNLTLEEDVDNLAKLFVNCLPKDKLKIAYQGDWTLRKWNYSIEEYNNGQTNTQGDCSKIISILEQTNKYSLINISPYNTANLNLDIRGYDVDPVRYALMASIIKNCDFFIGAEGGMANLASGLGTRCIISTCHMHKKFGFNGEMSKTHEVQLGPEVLFPNKGHINLDPCLNEEQVAEKIIENT